MKHIALLVLIVIGGCSAYLAFQSWHFTKSIEPPSEYTETREQKLERQRAEARLQMLRAITNDVIGSTRLIESSIRDEDQNPGKWTAEATVEHINHQGGIDRVHVTFQFGSTAGKIYCSLYPPVR